MENKVADASVVQNSLYLIKKIESSEYYGFCYTSEEAEKYCDNDFGYEKVTNNNQDINNLSDLKMIFIVYPDSTKKICNSWFATQEEAMEYIEAIEYIAQINKPDCEGFAVEPLYYIEDVLEDEDTHSANIGGTIDG